eukprot:SAG31_NODE_6089_length_2175_cov_3.355010_2_plen_87_part_00
MAGLQLCQGYTCAPSIGPRPASSTAIAAVARQAALAQWYKPSQQELELLRLPATTSRLDLHNPRDVMDGFGIFFESCFLIVLLFIS